LPLWSKNSAAIGTRRAASSPPHADAPVTLLSQGRFARSWLALQREKPSHVPLFTSHVSRFPSVRFAAPMTSATPAITVENLTKEFHNPSLFQRGTIVAVRDLSLTVAPGSVYGLLGPNGSGKSTTMKIVLGLIKPTAGRTLIFGRDSQEVESRESVGLLPENPYFYKFLTGEETIHFYGKLCGMSGKLLRDRAKELLALVGLEDAADRRIGGYSKGMLQRIGLAQALVQDPRLLVLDEPTAGVDPSGSRQICDLILELKERGVTVLLCSHLLSMVQEICDRIGIMHRGELVREGRLDELISIENQTELVLENAPPELLADLRARVAASGARLVAEQKPQQNLERYFLDVTKDGKPKD
jgi:ABC-2 type transport system ATP-binding protein